MNIAMHRLGASAQQATGKVAVAGQSIREQTQTANGSDSFGGLLVQVLGGSVDQTEERHVGEGGWLSTMLWPQTTVSLENLDAMWTQWIGEISEGLKLQSDSVAETELDVEIKKLLDGLVSALQAHLQGAAQTDATLLKTMLPVEMGSQMQQLFQLIAAWKQADNTPGLTEEGLAVKQTFVQELGLLVARVMQTAARMSGEHTSATAEGANSLAGAQRAASSDGRSVRTSEDTPIASRLSAQLLSMTGDTQQQHAAPLLTKPAYTVHMLQASTANGDGAALDTSVQTPTVQPVPESTTAGTLALAGNPASRPAMTEHAARPVHIPVPVHQFASEMNTLIVKNFKVLTGGGFSEARLSLIPEQLGQVEVKLAVHNGQLVAQFAADTLAGRDALEAQLQHLRASLHSQGIQVEKLEVTYQGAKEHMQQFQQQPRQHQQYQDQPSKRDDSRGEAIEDSWSEFEDELEPFGYGQHRVRNSFEASA